MPRVTHAVRSFEAIFRQAEIAGAENIFLNDAEVGIVLAGGGTPLTPATVANRRWRGELNVPVLRGASRQPLSRLSDVVAATDRRFRRGAA
jgi:hypothetical protein